MKKVIVAKLTNEGNTYIGKREVKLYDEKSELTDGLLKNANQGLTLDTQRSIREALKVKNGIKTISSGGESKDLSEIDEV